MPAGSEKFTGYLPVFEEQQPFRRPRDYGGGDRHLGIPVHLVRIPEAKCRPQGGAVGREARDGEVGELVGDDQVERWDVEAGRVVGVRMPDLHRY